ncbi:MAG: signal peptidase I [Candidatus Coatesbacteria bacterium]|mgnify:CR=1 FL=1
MNFFVKLGLFLLAVVMVGFAFGGWLTVGVTMTSSAMLPSIKDGMVVFVNRTSYQVRDLRRGEIVLVRVPGQELQVVRRIVGLPGETIDMQAGHVFINGNKIDEPWLAPLGADEPKLDAPLSDYFSPVVLGEGSYYVLSDFRKAGNDSRTFGPIRKDSILGTAWSIFGRVI